MPTPIVPSLLPSIRHHGMTRYVSQPANIDTNRFPQEPEEPERPRQRSRNGALPSFLRSLSVDWSAGCFEWRHDGCQCRIKLCPQHIRELGRSNTRKSKDRPTTRRGLRFPELDLDEVPASDEEAVRNDIESNPEMHGQGDGKVDYDADDESSTGWSDADQNDSDAMQPVTVQSAPGEPGNPPVLPGIEGVNQPGLGSGAPTLSALRKDKEPAHHDPEATVVEAAPLERLASMDSIASMASASVPAFAAPALPSAPNAAPDAAPDAAPAADRHRLPDRNSYSVPSLADRNSVHNGNRALYKPSRHLRREIRHLTREVRSLYKAQGVSHWSMQQERQTLGFLARVLDISPSPARASVGPSGSARSGSAGTSGPSQAAHDRQDPINSVVRNGINQTPAQAGPSQPRGIPPLGFFRTLNPPPVASRSDPSQNRPLGQQPRRQPEQGPAPATTYTNQPTKVPVQAVPPPPSSSSSAWSVSSDAAVSGSPPAPANTIACASPGPSTHHRTRGKSAPVYNKAKFGGTDKYGKRSSKGDTVVQRNRYPPIAKRVRTRQLAEGETPTLADRAPNQGQETDEVTSENMAAANRTGESSAVGVGQSERRSGERMTGQMMTRSQVRRGGPQRGNGDGEEERDQGSEQQKQQEDEEDEEEEDEQEEDEQEEDEQEEDDDGWEPSATSHRGRKLEMEQEAEEAAAAEKEQEDELAGSASGSGPEEENMPATTSPEPQGKKRGRPRKGGSGSVSAVTYGQREKRRKV